MELLQLERQCYPDMLSLPPFPCSLCSFIENLVLAGRPVYWLSAHWLWHPSRSYSGKLVKGCDLERSMRPVHEVDQKLVYSPSRRLSDNVIVPTPHLSGGGIT